MHLAALNLSDLMLSLWRGTIDCTTPDDKSTWTWAVLRGDVWQQHGKSVADTLHYLPSSFDRPPRNIAEKLTSGYKAWEFLLYLYGLAPSLLYGILPNLYYSNFCKLVHGIRLMNQHNISRQNVRGAHLALSSFAQEFEVIYCQRQQTRIHFVRPCLHSVLHLPCEVVRLGPPVCSSQWTLERTIGNLGEEIKQHSNPFANLSERGVRRARVNALKAMIPDLDEDHRRSLPRGSKDLGDGFVLLRAQDASPHPLRENELFPSTPPSVSVHRWAKLRIPTGQNCYSAWKEKQKPLEKRRTAQNVKDQDTALALVSLYSQPDSSLLRLSMNTLWLCVYLGDGVLKFVDVKAIQSVVTMIPHRPSIDGRPAEDRFFSVEKPGFDVAIMSGVEDDEQDNEDETACYAVTTLARLELEWR
ncbi:hypothetical protein H4582DRAFT_1803124 [Lactarius indigo]|nr:hypothetical protein H4582DRAFT_1803124 [Lactarius indigo]